MGSTFFIVVIAALAITTALFGFYAIRFGIILLRVQDQIEESLDILDSQYNQMSMIMELPLASDSPQVRQVFESLKASRQSVLDVANVLVGHSSLEEVEDIEEANQEKN